MRAQTCRLIVSCILLVLLTGCTEPVPDPSGFIEARLLSEYTAHSVDWEDIADKIDKERIEPILKEAIAADGAAVSKNVDDQLAIDFGRAINEQYEIDGQEHSGIRYLMYQGKIFEIIIELVV